MAAQSLMAWAFASSTLTDATSSLIHAYAVGIGIGVVVMTTLLLFPGSSYHCYEGVEPPDVADDLNSADNLASKETRGVPTTTERSSPNETGGSDDWSPHQVLNRAMYGIMICVALFVIDHAYPGVVTMSFRAYLPREMATLFGA
jgi:hypothetical protein